MLSKNDLSNILWKKLSDDVNVTHFTSKTKTEQIYLKHVKAKKKSSHPVTIFLFHDITYYHGRFSNLIEWFQTQYPEVSFVMMDFLGHGLSSGTRGHVGNFSDLVDDMATVFELMNKGENEQWVALGQGMGALVLLDLLNRFDGPIKEKIDKLILSNFFLNYHSKILNFQKIVFENFSAIANSLKTSRLVEAYLPGDLLSSAHEQASYLEDPLIVRRPTYESLKNISNKVKSVYQDSYFLDKPTLLLRSKSHYIMGHAVDSFGKGLKKGLLTEKKYFNLKHDLYNERENSLVFNDIAEWIFL